MGCKNKLASFERKRQFLIGVFVVLQVNKPLKEKSY